MQAFLLTTRASPLKRIPSSERSSGRLTSSTSLRRTLSSREHLQRQASKVLTVSWRALPPLHFPQAMRQHPHVFWASLQNRARISSSSRQVSSEAKFTIRQGSTPFPRSLPERPFWHSSSALSRAPCRSWPLHFPLSRTRRRAKQRKLHTECCIAA